jgi:hypothetical protein
VSALSTSTYLALSDKQNLNMVVLLCNFVAFVHCLWGKDARETHEHWKADTENYASIPLPDLVEVTSNQEIRFSRTKASNLIGGGSLTFIWYW